METTFIAEPSNGPPVTDNTPPLGTDKAHVDPITGTHTHADTLLATIQGHAETAVAKTNEIEQARLLAGQSRIEIDLQLTAMKEAVASLQQQVESGKALTAEVTNLHGNAEKASNETVEVKAEAAAALQSMQTLLSSTTEQAQAAAAKNNEIVEQARVAAEKSRAEIDGQLTAMKDSVANLQQQSDSGKALISEVTSLHGNAQKTSSETVEVKAQAAAALQSVQTLLGAATENANRVEAIKTNAEQAQGVIATKSDHIEGARVHADKVRGEIDRLFTDAQQSTTNAEAQHQASRTAMENLNNLYVSAQTIKANTDSNADMVAKLRQQCEEYAATAKRLADMADTTDHKVKAYEARLAELDVAAANRLKTIEGLLPGATSAGLASAFNQRRAHFKWPQNIWQGVFVASLLLLLGIAWLEFNLFSKPDAPLTWDLLGLSLLNRLPFALPLIWLAFHASHKAALAQRVEEDYAFKETVSRTFEGYRREMADLEGKAGPESALSQLCTGVLSVITNPPGRIYEKHRLNKTPLNALAESAGPIAEAASKMGPIKSL